MTFEEAFKNWCVRKIVRLEAWQALYGRSFSLCEEREGERKDFFVGLAVEAQLHIAELKHWMNKSANVEGKQK